MADLIRFSCKCGKRVAAPAKYAGREAKCPRCGESLTVPEKNPHATLVAKDEAAALESCRDSRLDRFYELVMKEFEGRIESHRIASGNPQVRFLLPDKRGQQIELSIEQDDHNHDLLVIRSEIGTLTLFDEAAKALRLNRDLQSGRLYLDDFQVLQLEHRERLDETDEAKFIRAVKSVARWADEFEEQLFGIDVR